MTVRPHGQGMTRILALAAASVLVLSVAACKVDGSVKCSPETQACQIDVTRVQPGAEPTSPTTTATTTTTTPTTTTTTQPAGGRAGGRQVTRRSDRSGDRPARKR